MLRANASTTSSVLDSAVIAVAGRRLDVRMLSHPGPGMCIAA